MPRRTRDDWTAIALAALAEGGLAALAIEPLAARVGATKGSVYWHFPTRDALIEATLRRWEDQTEAVIAHVERGGTPLERLTTLFDTVTHPDHDQGAELALLASTAEPLVAAAIERVTTRRTAYLTDLYVQLGFSREQAERRALIAYAIYLGQSQLARVDPAALPATSPTRRAHLADVLRVLLTDPGLTRPGTPGSADAGTGSRHRDGAPAAGPPPG